MMRYRLVLASASPRRKEILSLAGVPFEVMPSDFEERTKHKEPDAYVRALAAGKAETVARHLAREQGADPDEKLLVLGADTIVAHRGRILTKPKDRADAFRMLKALQGDAHEVFTGIAIDKMEADGQVFTKNFAVRTQVVFRPMSDDEIEGYLALGEYKDKAGAYAIQGRLAAYIREIHGDFYNVVGLPISAVAEALMEWGIALWELSAV